MEFVFIQMSFFVTVHGVKKKRPLPSALQMGNGLFVLPRERLPFFIILHRKLINLEISKTIYPTLFI